MNQLPARPLLLRGLSCLVILSGLATAANADEPVGQANESRPPIALVGGDILTLDEAGTIEGGTILITDGLVSAVGADVEIPESALRIDVTGMTISPGLIDCRSSLWLSSDSSSAQASDGSLNAVDGIDCWDESWREVARQGVTLVGVQPGGALGGLTAVAQVRSEPTVADLVIRDTTAMQASLGLSGRSGTSRDRWSQYETLKKSFEAARKYQEEWKAYEEAVRKAEETKADDKSGDEAGDAPASKTEPENAERPDTSRFRRGPPGTGRRPEGTGGRPGGDRFRRPDSTGAAQPASEDEAGDSSSENKTATDSKTAVPKKPKRDPLKDLLVRVLDGELVLRLEAHRADDVANALKLADEFKIRLVLEGLSHAKRSWSTVLAERVPLVAGPFVDFESAPEYLGPADERFRELKDHDGVFAVATFSRQPRGSRLLRFHAAEAIARGFSSDAVLRALTINAAKVLGVDQLTGTLSVGKRADLVVTAGDVLDPAAPVLLTMSGGEITFQQQDPPESIERTPASDTSLPAQLPTAYALVSERVLFPNGAMAPGAVLVSDGKITGVNRRRRTGDLTVFDLGSAVVTPGLVSGHMTSSDRVSEGAAIPWVRAADALNPWSVRLQKLARGGFTAVAFAPDSRSVCAGLVSRVRAASDQPVELSEGLPLAIASKFVLSSASRSTERFPAALSGQLTLLDNYFRGLPDSTDLYVPHAVGRLLREEQADVLKSLKSGTMPAVFEAETAGEIAGALQLIEEHDLRGVLLHPREFDNSLERIAALKAGLVLPTFRAADYDWSLDDAVRAARQGIRLAVSGDSAEDIRRTLALLVNAGLSSRVALRAATSDAAELCGLSGCGKLETDACADLVIWDGSPLDLSAKPLHVIIDGQLLKEAP